MKKRFTSSVDILRNYYQLTKPGIIKGNLITAIAGYLFGAQGAIDWAIFGGVLVGTVLVIAAGCVWNNVLDRYIDASMQRTKKRAIVTGTISPNRAYVFALALLIMGTAVLVVFTNMLTAVIGVSAFVLYVFVYGYAKRRSVHSTLVGALPGAAALVAGYTAAAGRLDVVACMLFLAMVLWQMPHFYAIAIYRRKEYKAAGLPVLSVVRSSSVVRRYIIGYIALFGVVMVLFPKLAQTSLWFGGVMGVISVLWLRIALSARARLDLDAWARKVFGFSLLVLLALSVMLSIDNILP